MSPVDSSCLKFTTKSLQTALLSVRPYIRTQTIIRFSLPLSLFFDRFSVFLLLRPVDIHDWQDDDGGAGVAAGVVVDDEGGLPEARRRHRRAPRRCLRRLPRRRRPRRHQPPGALGHPRQLHHVRRLGGVRGGELLKLRLRAADGDHGEEARGEELAAPC